MPAWWHAAVTPGGVRQPRGKTRDTGTVSAARAHTTSSRCPAVPPSPRSTLQHPAARRPSSGAVGAARCSLQQPGEQGRVTFLDTQSAQQGLAGTSNTFSKGFFKYQGGNRTVIFFFCKVKFLWLPPNLPPPCANRHCCQGALQDL